MPFLLDDGVPPSATAESDSEGLRPVDICDAEVSKGILNLLPELAIASRADRFAARNFHRHVFDHAAYEAEEANEYIADGNAAGGDLS